VREAELHNHPDYVPTSDILTAICKIFQTRTELYQLYVKLHRKHTTEAHARQGNHSVQPHRKLVLVLVKSMRYSQEPGEILVYESAE